MLCCSSQLPLADHRSITSVRPFTANPSQLLKRGVYHGPATPKTSATELPHHCFSAHDVLQGKRVYITSERHLPWAKSISKIITWVSKARAHLAARTISWNLGHSYSNTSILVQQSNFPKSCTYHQKSRKKKKIRLILVRNSPSEFRVQKPHQEQLHAESYFIQKTASAEIMGQCWTPARERKISQLALLCLLPLKMQLHRSFSELFSW